MISVCIATYNGEKYIKEQLESILIQLSQNDEIIISDDYSSDSTINIVNSFNDPRIKIVYNENEHGYTSNFENALIHSSGDYIFLSDQDDVWLPDKVSVCMHTMQVCDFVVSDALVVDSNLGQLHKSYFKIRKSRFSFWGNFISFGTLGCCMAFRRDVLSKALKFPKNRVKCTHDQWLLTVASCYYSVKYIKKPLILYRRHNSNSSSGGFKNTTTLLFKISYRLYLLYHLICRCNR